MHRRGIGGVEAERGIGRSDDAVEITELPAHPGEDLEELCVLRETLRPGVELALTLGPVRRLAVEDRFQGVE